MTSDFCVRENSASIVIPCKSVAEVVEARGIATACTVEMLVASIARIAAGVRNGCPRLRPVDGDDDDVILKGCFREFFRDPEA
jgi:hypothetical protein